jgi:ribonuclease R
LRVLTEALDEAQAAALPLSRKHREDLRHLPIVAIDPSDARDHDDAIWAQPDGQGGFRAVVAIADVSFYVRPGGQIDRDARKRGNSVYFPDRVVPMLPEVLSADVCSLKSGGSRGHGLPPDIAPMAASVISASPAPSCASPK